MSSCAMRCRALRRRSSATDSTTTATASSTRISFAVSTADPRERPRSASADTGMKPVRPALGRSALRRFCLRRRLAATESTRTATAGTCRVSPVGAILEQDQSAWWASVNVPQAVPSSAIPVASLATPPRDPPSANRATTSTTTATASSTKTWFRPATVGTCARPESASVAWAHGLVPQAHGVVVRARSCRPRRSAEMALTKTVRGAISRAPPVVETRESVPRVPSGGALAWPRERGYARRTVLNVTRCRACPHRRSATASTTTATE